MFLEKYGAQWSVNYVNILEEVITTEYKENILSLENTRQ